MTTKILRSLLSALVVVSSASFMLSCGGDNDGDAKDCNAFAKAVSEETDEWLEALLSQDCEAIENAYNELIDVYEDAMGCDAIENQLKDLGYDYDEWINELENQRDLDLADC